MPLTSISATEYPPIVHFKRSRSLFIFVQGPKGTAFVFWLLLSALIKRILA